MKAMFSGKLATMRGHFVLMHVAIIWGRVVAAKPAVDSNTIGTKVSVRRESTGALLGSIRPSCKSTTLFLIKVT